MQGERVDNNNKVYLKINQEERQISRKRRGNHTDWGFQQRHQKSDEHANICKALRETASVPRITQSNYHKGMGGKDRYFQAKLEQVCYSQAYERMFQEDGN